MQIALSNFVNFIARNDRVNTWGFIERLNNKSGARYNVSTSVTSYFGFVTDTTKRYTLEWSTKSTSYTLTEWSFTRVRRPNEKKYWALGGWWARFRKGGGGGGFVKGWVHYWKVKPVVSASIGATVSVFLSRFFGYCSDSCCFPCFLVRIEFFQKRIQRVVSWFFSRPKWSASSCVRAVVRNILSRVTEERVENDDVDELGHGIEVSPQAA